MAKVWPIQTITVDLTTEQKDALAAHHLAVPSQGAIFAQVWPTHLRVAVYSKEEAMMIADTLNRINKKRVGL